MHLYTFFLIFFSTFMFRVKRMVYSKPQLLLIQIKLAVMVTYVITDIIVFTYFTFHY